jgi:hypothetical protein
MINDQSVAKHCDLTSQLLSLLIVGRRREWGSVDVESRVTGFDMLLGHVLTQAVVRAKR